MRYQPKIACATKCGTCNKGRKWAKINSDFMCDSCGQLYCSNAVRIENITRCTLCGVGKVVKNTKDYIEGYNKGYNHALESLKELLVNRGAPSTISLEDVEDSLRELINKN